MKYIITEQQLEKIKENVLKLDFEVFNNDWDLLQKFLSRRGNPPYILIGDLKLYDRQDIKSLGSLIEVEGSLYLRNIPIKSLGNLTSVRGDLDLQITSIKSLGNLTYVDNWLVLNDTPIKDLGNLTSVGGWLDLTKTPIQSLGNLTSVGGSLNLKYTPISRKYTERQIRDMVQVDGNIYL